MCRYLILSLGCRGIISRFNSEYNNCVLSRNVKNISTHDVDELRSPTSHLIFVVLVFNECGSCCLNIVATHSLNFPVSIII